MSGGHFDYNQHYINYIVEELESIIKKNDEEYPDDIIEEFKNGLNYLKLASIYATRIDYLICGDDGEESFRNRLKKELKKLKNYEK